MEKKLAGYPVLANGIRKCGTHLLLSSLQQIKGLSYTGFLWYFDTAEEIASEKKQQIIQSLNENSRGDFYSGHIVPDPEILRSVLAKDYRTILIVRDPRDVACSHVFDTLKREDYRFYQYYRETLRNDEERLMVSICGVSSKYARGSTEPLPNIEARFRVFLPWINQTSNLTVRFEDLIGPKGNGTIIRQYNTLTRISNHIGLNLDRGELERIAQNTYNPKSETFHRGQIGVWKDMFRQTHVQMFKKIAGNLLVELGYENNTDW